LAHALQGASANLGLSRVQQAAHQLEQAAAARHPEACRRLLPPLLERLEQVRIELAADDEAGSLASHTDVLVDEEAVRALQQLEVQLEGCQGEALDTLEQLRLDLGDPSWLRPLTEELSRFNFEGALDQLRRVRAQGSSAR
jgi:HPt (histidine-containing phosphotransfer) domain-containing protein